MKDNDLSKPLILLALLGLAMLLILVSDSFSRLVIPILLSCIFLVIIGLVIHQDIAAGKFDLFQPLVWIGIIFFLPNFIVKTWYNMVVDPDVYFLKRLYHQDFYLQLSLATGLLSYICLIAGYHALPFKNRFGRMFFCYKQSTYDAQALKWPSFIMWLLGLALSLYHLTTGELGYTDIRESTPFLHVIQLMAKSNIYGMFIFLYCFVKVKPYRDISWNILLATILLGQCLLGFLIGSRGYLFLNGIILIAALQYSGYLTNNIRRFIWPALLTGVLLVVGMVFITQFREIKRERLGYDKPLTAKGAVDIYEEMGQRKQLRTWEDVLDFLSDNFIQRTVGMESLASVLGKADQLKKMEKAYGIDDNIIKELLWSLVPRFIYPEKPIISDFSVKFGILYCDNPVTMRSWASPTVMGDLYRNFRFLGIILGMFLWGLCLRALYLILIDNNNNPFLFLISFFTIVQFNYEGTYAGLYHGSFRLWIIFGGFIIFMGWMYKFIVHQNLASSRMIRP